MTPPFSDVRDTPTLRHPERPDRGDPLRPLRQRLNRVKGDRSVAWLAAVADVHRETMRRYLTGQSPPSALALMQICHHGEISPEWLLLGRGPMRREPSVSEATPTELLSSLATWIERSGEPAPA
jgi:hypothetical protein